MLDAIHYSYPTHWSASSRERLRSTVGIAAVKTAIEYEYRFTEYRFTEYRFAAYEYDEIRCEARTTMLTEPPPTRLPFRNGPTGASVHHFFVWRLFSKANVALPIARKGEWVVVRFEQIVQHICPMVEFQLAFGSRDRYTPNKLYGIRPNLKSVTKR